jgi:exopolysaccharide biosynthesis protein
MAKKEKKVKSKLDKAISFKKTLLVLLSVGLIMMGGGLFALYGPWSYVREWLVTTAMTTMTHQYLATSFYNNYTIANVQSNNKVIEVNEETDTNLIDITDRKSSTVYANEYEKAVLDHEEGALYKVININDPGYRGYLVAVYDPSKVSIAVTKYLGTRGESTKEVAKETGAHVVMNAGGFYDPDWNSRGQQPHGTVYSNGKKIGSWSDAAVGGGFMGFTKDNKFGLCPGCSDSKIASLNVRDGVEFGPFLIVNGKASFVKGNGGWGTAPRSAIGQRADGIVLMLVMDGRDYSKGVLGADMVYLTETMQKYGAVNAANLDGGSSSSLVIEGSIRNKPVAGGSEGLRFIPTFWVVKD